MHIQVNAAFAEELKCQISDPSEPQPGQPPAKICRHCACALPALPAFAIALPCDSCLYCTAKNRSLPARAKVCVPCTKTQFLVVVAVVVAPKKRLESADQR